MFFLFELFLRRGRLPQGFHVYFWMIILEGDKVHHFFSFSVVIEGRITFSFRGAQLSRGRFWEGNVFIIFYGGGGVS